MTTWSWTVWDTQKQDGAYVGPCSPWYSTQSCLKEARGGYCEHSSAPTPYPAGCRPASQLPTSLAPALTLLQHRRSHPNARQCDEKVSQLMFSWARYTKLHQITRNAFTIQENLVYQVKSEDSGWLLAALMDLCYFTLYPSCTAPTLRALSDKLLKGLHWSLIRKLSVLSFSHFGLALPSK